MTQQARQLHDGLLREGESLHQAGRFGEALLLFRQALQLMPGQPGALLDLGACLHDLGNFEEAVAAYSEALSVDPRFAPAYNNRGNAYLELGRYEASARDYLRALEFMPRRPELYASLATALQALGRLDDAKFCCEKALALDPDCAEAHCNLALALLLEGDYQRGWREWEWRWRKKGFSSPVRSFAQPLWDGSAFFGRTLLLHAEQGFGDAIQFARFLPLAAARGGRVVVECHRELVSLFSRIDGICAAFPFGAPLPPFDLHAPFLTLPLLFGTTLDKIPCQIPYLSPDPELVLFWRRRLSQIPGFKVGLVWAGSKSHKNDRERSLPFSLLAGVLGAPVQFFTLQLGEANRDFTQLRAPNLHDLTAQLQDFDATAALVENLDLVLSVDTAVAHLAAALGKPVWLMIAKAPDWRWLLERADSPWYPGLRIFRQREQGEWGGVVNRVRAALESEVAPLCGVTEPAVAGRVQELICEGLSLYQAGEAARAEGRFRAALELDPGAAGACRCLGLLLAESGRLQEALELYRACLRHSPQAFDLQLLMAEALQALDRLEEARQCLARLLSLDPANAAAAYRLGVVLHMAQRPEEALAAFARADTLSPGDPRTQVNLGMAAQSLGRVEQAQGCFQRALSLDPGYALARWNLAQVQLLRGDFAGGLANFEARFQKSNPVPGKYGRIRRWQGEPLAGRRLLVWAEQAFGDVIQFVRYLPLLAPYGGEVHFDCGFESLLSLTRGMAGVASVFVGEKEEFAAEFQVPLLSLPGLLGTGAENVPARVPYIEAPPDRLARWQELSQSWEGLRVGLVWAGRREPDPNRSASLGALAPLARLHGVTFFSFQLGEEARQLREAPQGMRIVDLTPSIRDFADTAAAMRQLDLMISVDTAAAHLAGALGVPTFALLPFAPDWRWLLDREDTPWYPTLTLFRQRRRGEWGEVVGRVSERLQMLAGAGLEQPG